MTDGIILLDKALNFLLDILASLFCDIFQFGNYLTFLIEIGILLTVLTCTCGLTSLEELIASTKELLPELVAEFLRHNTDGLPLFLQGDELIASSLPVGRVLQSLCLLDEGAFLLGILLEGVL